ncbi:hypothetical protein F5878DRAFT_667135 [Lentinula raphanica]|uniref:Uncharacterized protein n=1 Tax=Lentinula raphanica TaxID=153919 RepID=A0AA38U420_9AGAR|nr:hypothetical protein F5878DRAFT_667135 [Lentinula raphanica]
MLTIAGNTPVSQPFNTDYADALHILDRILDSRREPGIGWKASGFTFNDIDSFNRSSRYVIFSHPLFEILNSPPTNISKYRDRYNVWTTAGWPMSTSQATNEQREIVSNESHIVRPLPLATFIDSPKDYHALLAGNLAVITFTVKHWIDRSHRVDIFHAEIVTIDPILPLPPSPDDMLRRLLAI